MHLHPQSFDQATINSREKLINIYQNCQKNRYAYFPSGINDLISNGTPLRVIVFSTRGLGFCQQLDQIEAAVKISGGTIEALVHDTGDTENINNIRLSGYLQITTDYFFKNTSKFNGCLIVDRTSTWYPGIRYKTKFKNAGFDFLRVEQFLNAPGLERSGGCYRSHSDLMLSQFDDFLALERHWKDPVSLQTYYYALASFISMNHQYFALNCGDFKKRYFSEDIDLKFGPNTVYADCGSHDGAEILIFAERANGQFKEIHAFEPDHKNFLNLTNTVHDFIAQHGKQSIYCHELGVFDRDGYLHAEGYAGGVTITEKAATLGSGLHVCKLDSILNELTHLRLEIEGAELAALQGARHLIKKNRPTMTISAYHLATDFLDLLNFIEETDLNYQLSLRHQSLEPGVLCIYAV